MILYSIAVLDCLIFSACLFCLRKLVKYRKEQTAALPASFPSWTAVPPSSEDPVTAPPAGPVPLSGTDAAQLYVNGQSAGSADTVNTAFTYAQNRYGGSGSTSNIIYSGSYGPAPVSYKPGGGYGSVSNSRMTYPGGGGGGGGGSGGGSGFTARAASISSSPGVISVSPASAIFPVVSGMPLFGDEDLDTAIGTVRGYRWWTYPVSMFLFTQWGDPGTRDPDTWRFIKLKGNTGFNWTPGLTEYRAKCNNNPLHEPPVSRTDSGPCGCGFWAYWSEEASRHYASSSALINIQGVIEGYGKVIIGAKGFRSEKAKIKALLPVVGYDRSLSVQPEDHRKALRALARGLQLQYRHAEVFTDVDVFLEAYPADENYGKP